MLRVPVHRLLAGGLLCAGALVLILLAGQRNLPGNLLPHGYCFTWNPALLWTHVTSDTLIGLAYVSIPLTLVHLVRKRGDLPFNWIILLFATFIVSCGATHWIEVWTVWNPDYWLSGAVKVITATASVLTAGALVYLVPGILAIPTVAQLTSAKDALEAEVRQRRAVEEELRRERAELERRVAERTQQLARATASAEAAHATAEQANRQKDSFLAKVSHELRTPLQSTLSWAEVLSHVGVDQARARLAAERIIHNVNSQARLIDDLLDISRILSGKLHLDLTETDAVAVIERAIDVVRVAAKARRIEVQFVSGAAEIRMLTDPARLEQVVWNLLSNAVQSTPGGGTVRLAAAADDAALRIEVEDWGHGIAADELPRIFEPFRQGGHHDNSHRGLGLGLAITRSIVDLFGGELHAHSDGPGRGARFLVRLPMRRDDMKPPPAIASAAGSVDDSAPLRGLRVLFVEDDRDIADSGMLLLGDLGAQAELCLTFDEACRRLVEASFDVLLSDLNLDHGRTGIELLHALRRLPHGRDVPAVILSAYGTEDDRAATRAAGFVVHLVKPMTAAAVARALLDACTMRG